MQNFRTGRATLGLSTGRFSLVRAYGLAILLPCCACLLTRQISILGHVPFALFLGSIAITAWFGLAGSTTLAVLMSLGFYNVYLDPPLGRLSTKPDDLIRLAVVGLVGGLIGFLILRLKRTQAVVAASEAFYRTTLASIGDAVIATDQEGAVTFMNSVAGALTGWDEEQVMGKPLSSFFLISNEETGATVENPVDKVPRLGRVVGMANHTLLQRRDGSKIPIDDSAAPIRTANGTEAGIVLIFRDVTERRQLEKQERKLFEQTWTAEQEMRDLLAVYDEQTKALSLAQQAGKSAAWVMDVEKQEVKWLPGGFEIFGMPFSDFAGKVRPISMVEPEDQPIVEMALKRTLETGVPFICEFRLRWPNGELHWQEARGVPDPENRHIIRGTTFDITERKHAESSLLRVEKLAAVGRISSTIAHEINNPLAAVTNLLYLALLDTSLGTTIRGYLSTAQEELSRLANITRLTLSYARPQVQPREVDPVEVIESVLFLFRIRLEAKGIRVVRLFPANGAIKVSLYVDELQRILTNLMANAIDAVGISGGIVQLVVEANGAGAVIAIEDNGVGIPDDRRERIFEPFFTTKEEVGTGIGLWVTKELVEKNGGSISFTSATRDEGTRTRFELRFPLPASSAHQAA